MIIFGGNVFREADPNISVPEDLSKLVGASGLTVDFTVIFTRLHTAL